MVKWVQISFGLYSMVEFDSKPPQKILPASYTGTIACHYSGDTEEAFKAVCEFSSKISLELKYVLKLLQRYISHLCVSAKRVLPHPASPAKTWPWWLRGKVLGPMIFPLTGNLRRILVLAACKQAFIVHFLALKIVPPPQPHHQERKPPHLGIFDLSQPWFGPVSSFLPQSLLALSNL